MEKLSYLSVLAAMIAVSTLMSCRQDNLNPTELSNISVKTPPSKIEYIAGEVLDLSGLVVELSWDNGISEDVAFSDFVNNGIICDPVSGTELSVNSTFLTITHLVSGKNTNQTITVSDVTGISVKTPPSKMEYIVGDVLDLSGLVVELFWDNGISEDVAFSDFVNKGIICAPADGTVLALSSKEVVITHTTNNSTIQHILVFGSVTDIENNTYKTIQIGNQIWMAENLKTRYYANGDTISDGTSVGDISGVTDPKYWFSYNDDLNNVSTYGLLYTWYTLNDNRNVCPSGWHIPANIEWSELVNHLGGEFVAGGKLKENGTLQWFSPNEGATNESGFTALPGGTRGYGGFYGNLGYGGNWWSSTENTVYEGYSWGLSFNNESVYYGGSDKKVGFSIRCLKD